jgi:hypothetical protein
MTIYKRRCRFAAPFCLSDLSAALINELYQPTCEDWEEDRQYDAHQIRYVRTKGRRLLKGSDVIGFRVCRFKNDRRFWILAVVGDFSRENFVLVADTSLSGQLVARERVRVIAERIKDTLCQDAEGAVCTGVTT